MSTPEANDPLSALGGGLDPRQLVGVLHTLANELFSGLPVTPGGPASASSLLPPGLPGGGVPSPTPAYASQTPAELGGFPAPTASHVPTAIGFGGAPSAPLSNGQAPSGLGGVPTANAQGPAGLAAPTSQAGASTVSPFSAPLRFDFGSDLSAYEHPFGSPTAGNAVPAETRELQAPSYVQAPSQDRVAGQDGVAGHNRVAGQDTAPGHDKARSYGDAPNYDQALGYDLEANLDQVPSYGEAPKYDKVLGFDRSRGNAEVPSFEQAPSHGQAPSYGQLPSAAPPSAKSPGATAPGGGSPSGFRPSSYAYELDPAVGVSLRPGAGLFDPVSIRREFPILEERVHGKRLVWLDNAATTQKPQVVIDRLTHFYEHENSNIHRAAHTLAGRATDAYESARESTRRFLNASSREEIVFVRGATEGINLVAQTFGRRNVGPGDEIVITWLEHHANIVPWQLLCSEKGARLRVAPVDDRGNILLDEYEKLLGPRTKLVSMPVVSNAIGTVVPVAEMVALAHRHGARVVVDGAQSVSHRKTDVQALDADFFVFSGHKVFAPTGIGAVYAKREVLEHMPPWQGGGNMIADVTFERSLFQKPPARFEAGTGNIADAAGLGAALDWLERLGLGNVERYEHELITYAERCLATVPGLSIVGNPKERAGVVSFVLDGQRTEDVGGILDQEGIAVRSGHHCAQPILRRFGLEASVRASFAPYNLFEDVDKLVEALRRLQANRQR